MIDDPQVAARVAGHLKESFKQLDDSAFEVRQHGSPREISEYLKALGPISAEIIFKLMDPIYKHHPELAPADWDTPSTNPPSEMDCKE